VCFMVRGLRGCGNTQILGRDRERREICVLLEVYDVCGVKECNTT
jgi:hypothetical protein